MSENEVMDRNAEVSIKRIEFYLPKWVEMLPEEHEMKLLLINVLKKQFKGNKSKAALETELRTQLEEIESVDKVTVLQSQDMDSVLKVMLDFDVSYYYAMMSEMAGVPIEGEYQLISLIREFSKMKEEYGKVSDAVLMTRNAGYAVIKPSHDEIHLEKPVITQQGNKYGVKIKALSSSIHMLKAEIETEIAPIVGNEQQAKDLIEYIESSGEEIWNTNIFGKSIEQLIEEEISTKVNCIGKEGQEKIKRILQKIMDESTGGFICIII